MIRARWAVYVGRDGAVLFAWVAIRLRRWRGTIPPVWSRREIVVPLTVAGVRSAMRRIANRANGSERPTVGQDGSTG